MNFHRTKRECGLDGHRCSLCSRLNAADFTKLGLRCVIACCWTTDADSAHNLVFAAAGIGREGGPRAQAAKYLPARGGVARHSARGGYRVGRGRVAVEGLCQEEEVALG
eukprot:6184372-Pleurochrysis_carterae.AAC.3